MDCDRSALLKKAIKATARLFENEHGLAGAFGAFGAIIIVFGLKNRLYFCTNT